MNKIRRAQSMATTPLPMHLPSHIKVRQQQNRRLHKLWARTRCPKLTKELNSLIRKISMAIRDFRGAAWEMTIDRSSESSKNLNQLTRASTPVCPIANRAGIRCYDAQARAEVIADYLE
ncbi:hypothetical protein EVAR_93390_1 [Eumeta japonica]|uniref:RNA-directed DNA polymerase from transposon X-element n=1 Tax=Eumeta variegata TaxID=151549 RepID=A0A4C1UPP5_EUMVA|nr:hypothetical protein EVAR_93390_1 [Eumeta japonica]